MYMYYKKIRYVFKRHPRIISESGGAASPPPLVKLSPNISIPPPKPPIAPGEGGNASKVSSNPEVIGAWGISEV